MKRLKGILALLVIVALLAMPAVALGSDLSRSLYYGLIQVTNNSTAVTNVATTCAISTINLINGGYLSSSANNCAIQSSAGADLPFQPSVNATYPWGLWVPSMGENSIKTDILYTANTTGGHIRYFPGIAGMATSDDDPDLEIGDNFTISQNAFWNTAYSGNTSGMNTVYKEGAFRTFISGEEEVASAIPHTTFGEIPDDGIMLDFVAAASDWVSIPDSDDFSFVTGAVDEPFSIVAWVFPSDVVNTQSIVAKYSAAAVEWSLFTGDEVTFNTYIPDASAKIGRDTGAASLTPYDDSWVHIVATYDGSEVNGGCNIYMFGVDADTQDAGGGAYINMVNNAAVVSLGAANDGGAVKLDGGIGEVKIYSVELTPAEALADYYGWHKTADLVAWYEIDEMAGNPQDSSGNAHHATANLADWVRDTRVTATGVTTAEHTIATSANISHMWITLDSVVEETIAIAAGVPDTGNDWTFFQQGATPYAGTAANSTLQEIWIDGVLQQRIVWEYDTTFTDLSGEGHDATPSFITASTDADVSAELVSFLPISEAQAPAYVLEEAVPFIEEVPVIVSDFDVSPDPAAGEFPLAGVIATVAAATTRPTPAQLPLVLIAGFTIIALSLAISGIMRKYGSGTIFVKILLIAGTMGVFVGLGNFGIDFWLLFVFLIIAIALAMSSRHVSWQ